LEASKRWFVYAKEPFAGPRQVLAYLSRYTHRVAISNRRLIQTDGNAVTFRVKNYRANGCARYSTMALDIAEFIRRFLLHVLPKGFRRIRHYGLLATGQRENIERARELLDAPHPRKDPKSDDAGSEATTGSDLPPCSCCGGRVRIIETFCVARRRGTARHRAASSSGSTHHDNGCAQPSALCRDKLVDRRLR
jgi:hypothetical protein